MFLRMVTKDSGLRTLARLLGRIAAGDYRAKLAELIKVLAPKGGRTEWRSPGRWLIHWPRSRGQRIARRSLWESHAPPAKRGSD